MNDAAERRETVYAQVFTGDQMRAIECVMHFDVADNLIGLHDTNEGQRDCQRCSKTDGYESL